MPPDPPLPPDPPGYFITEALRNAQPIGPPHWTGSITTSSNISTWPIVEWPLEPKGPEVTQARKPRAPRTTTKKPEVLKGLTPEQVRFVTEHVMASLVTTDDERRELIEKMGLPRPPLTANVVVMIKIPVDTVDVTSSYGTKQLTKAASERIRGEVAEKVTLPDGWILDVASYSGNGTSVT